MKRTLATTTLALWTALAWSSTVPVTVDVQVNKPGTTVSPLLFGVFFEDINFAADGGLYAELVQNRSFEHGDAFTAWGLVNRGGEGTTSIATERPLNANNPRYVRLDIKDAGAGFGLANYGFAGIAVRKDDTYLLSFFARASKPMPLHLAIENESGRVLATANVDAPQGDWQKVELTLVANDSSKNARLVVAALADGRVDLDMVSLFPEKTYKGRRNGMRADIAEKVEALRPAFIRFPGGCIVEGERLEDRYQWKHSIGKIEERRQNTNRWQAAIQQLTSPNYHQTYGLGFFEYFQFAEDIGAKPVPILNVGMACQFQSGELVPLDELDPYIQDALDLIEFANGPVTSTWGAKRAEMGHPAPFNLEYIGIGNEQWGEEYFKRYDVFAREIRKRYPDIKLVSGSGAGVDDESWQLAWRKFHESSHAHVVDEHYYRPPQWFLENATRYDAQSRECPKEVSRATGTCPKVFAGEYAAHEKDRRSTLRAAISESAFMTGLVRNSDLVVMSSYAPLLARADAYQWAPDLIWFDNTRVFGTPSYYVQRMYSRNRPDVLLPVEVKGDPVELALLPPESVATFRAVPLKPFAPEFIPPLYAAGGLSAERDEVVLFLSNPFPEVRDATVRLHGAKLGALATLTQLTADSPDAINSLDAPEAVTPKELTLSVDGSIVSAQLPAYSLTVIRVPTSSARSKR
jgi:alpha-N-arabinofuranosidase